MFGYRENEFFGDDFAQLVPQYFDRDPMLLRRLRLGAPCGCTGGTILALARTRGHATFPVEISLSETVVDDTSLYVAMIRDITERKRFEEELAAEKKSLAVTLGSIGDGVITIDLGGRIVVCNAASETMTGWAASEAVGRLVKDRFPSLSRGGTQRERLCASPDIAATPRGSFLPWLNVLFSLHGTGPSA